MNIICKLKEDIYGKVTTMYDIIASNNESEALKDE